MEKKKFFTTRYDLMFKSIFCDKNNQDLLEYLLSKCLQKEVKVLQVRSPELIKNNIYEKEKTLDVVVDVEGEVINLELNSGYYTYLHQKNAAYIFSKYAKNFNAGDGYSETRKYIQINFTYGLSKKEPEIGQYTLNNINTKKSFIDDLIIYEYNVDRIKNEKKKELGFIAMLDSNKEELSKICTGDKMMEKFKSEVERLNEDKLTVGFLVAEEEAEKLRNTLIDEAISEGEASEKIVIAKNMLKDNVDVNLVAKYTGLTEREIEILK